MKQDIEETKNDGTEKANLIQRLKSPKNRNMIILAISLTLIALTMVIGRNNIAFVVSAYFLNIALCLIILNKYPDKSIFTKDSYITTALGLFLVFSVVGILPLDAAHNIVLNNKREDTENIVEQAAYKQEIQDYQQDYKLFWIFTYWTFSGTSIVMTVQQYFHNEGHIKFASRLKATLKLLLILGAIGAGVLLVAFLIIEFAINKSAAELMYSCALVGSQVYGITILCFLLGFGLFQLPVNLWFRGNLQKQFETLLITTNQVFTDFREARIELVQSGELMKNLISKIPRGHELQNYVKQLEEEIPENNELKNLTSMGQKSGNSGRGGIGGTKWGEKWVNKKRDIEKQLCVSLKELREVNENQLAKGRMILLKKKFNYVKCHNKWRKHQDKFYKMVDLGSLEEVSSYLKETGQNNLSFMSQTKKKFDKKNGLLTDSLIDIDSVKNEDMPIVKVKLVQPLKLWAYRILAIICLCFSFIIVWSESVLIFEFDDLIINFDIIKNSTRVGGIVVFMLLVLLYMIWCCMHTLLKLDLKSFYSVYPKHTHHISLVMCAQYCGTIMFPLCYNMMMIFGQISPKEITDSDNAMTSGFDVFFAPMKNVPFVGQYYEKFIAISIAVIGVLSLFFGTFKIFRRVTKHSNDPNSDGGRTLKTDVKNGQRILINYYEKKKQKEKLDFMIQNSVLQKKKKAQQEKELQELKEKSQIAYQQSGKNNEDKERTLIFKVYDQDQNHNENIDFVEMPNITTSASTGGGDGYNNNNYQQQQQDNKFLIVPNQNQFNNNETSYIDIGYGGDNQINVYDSKFVINQSDDTKSKILRKQQEQQQNTEISLDVIENSNRKFIQDKSVMVKEYNEQYVRKNSFNLDDDDEENNNKGDKKGNDIYSDQIRDYNDQEDIKQKKKKKKKRKNNQNQNSKKKLFFDSSSSSGSGSDDDSSEDDQNIVFSEVTQSQYIRDEVYLQQSKELRDNENSFIEREVENQSQQKKQQNQQLDNNQQNQEQQSYSIQIQKEQEQQKQEKQLQQNTQQQQDSYSYILRKQIEKQQEEKVLDSYINEELDKQQKQNINKDQELENSYIRKKLENDVIQQQEQKVLDSYINEELEHQKFQQQNKRIQDSYVEKEIEKQEQDKQYQQAVEERKKDNSYIKKEVLQQSSQYKKQNRSSSQSSSSSSDTEIKKNKQQIQQLSKKSSKESDFSSYEEQQNQKDKKQQQQQQQQSSSGSSEMSSYDMVDKVKSQQQLQQQQQQQQEQDDDYLTQSYIKQVQEQKPMELTESMIFQKKENLSESMIQQKEFMRGFVYKKANSKFQRKLKGWVKKYMEFSYGTLHYWDELKKKKPEKIDIKEIKKVLLYSDDVSKKEKGKEEESVFIVYCKDRDYKLNTDSLQESQNWVNFLTYQIQQYKLKKK